MPPNMTPPLILNYNAATVPILQLALSAKGMSEQAVFDIAINTVRTPLVTVPARPSLFRSAQVPANPDRPRSGRHAGARPVGQRRRQRPCRAEPFDSSGHAEDRRRRVRHPAQQRAKNFAALADLPVFAANGTIVYLRDVAQVRDGNPPQQNSSMSTAGVRHAAGAEEWRGVDAGHHRRHQAKGGRAAWVAADNLSIAILGDQSLFVESAITGVITEAAIAAILTSLMILLFLGSWRSTIIIATSIPLAIFAAIATLAAAGETLNIMTLGGLALAVGILVDDATVTIGISTGTSSREKASWRRSPTAHSRSPRRRSCRRSASASCSCRCSSSKGCRASCSCHGPGRDVRNGLVVLSVAHSGATMAAYLLKPHMIHGHDGPPPTRNPLVMFQRAFETRFERFRAGYRDALGLALHHRGIFIGGFLAFVAASFLLTPYLGRNFFPSVDAGQILMHARAPIGMRVEETANRFADIEKEIAGSSPRTRSPRWSTISACR